jgi:TetR/AcrR family transcriptional repressor of nem operon
MQPGSEELGMGERCEFSGQMQLTAFQGRLQAGDEPAAKDAPQHGVPGLQRLGETADPTLQSSKSSGGLTESCDDPKAARATVPPTSHAHWREVMKLEEGSSQESGAQLGLPFRLFNIDTVGMSGARKSPKRRATRRRDSERTRERLLQAASREIYRSGFQSASLDTILAVAGVTKGALYYHFDSKETLGHAVVDEVIAPDVRSQWVRPLQSGKDPIATLIGAVQGIPVRPGDVRGGCQLNNLAQEMSPLNAGFRKRLATIFDAWREAVASVLQEGQAHGSVRRDVEPADAAGLLIAMVEGYGSLAKNAQDPKVMKEGIRNIVIWLRSLRPPGNRKRG